jgi:hypothetical protein
MKKPEVENLVLMVKVPGTVYTLLTGLALFTCRVLILVTEVPSKSRPMNAFLLKARGCHSCDRGTYSKSRPMNAFLLKARAQSQEKEAKHC